MVTQCGYRRGESFEGCEERAWERREGLIVALSGKRDRTSKTARTSWLVAGCNRPAKQLRSKPSKSRKTARTEGVLRLAT